MIEKSKEKIKNGFSEIRPSNEYEARIWLLNTHEFRRRQKRYIGSAQQQRDPKLFGLANLCGPNCSVRLRHGQVVGKSGIVRPAGEMLRIRLQRQEPLYKSKERSKRRW